MNISFTRCTYKSIGETPILQYEDFDVKKQFRIGKVDFQLHLKQKGYTIFACRTPSLRSMTEEVVGMACGRADPKIRGTDEVPF